MATVLVAGCSLGGRPAATVSVTPSAPDPTPPVAASSARSPDPSPAPPHPASTPRPGGHPAGSRYPAQAHGYDISYPQCADAAGPAGAAFAIVGVNGGRAFTRNSCLFDEWSRTKEPRSVYLNSGYNPDNYQFVEQPCRDLAERLGGSTPAARQAYAIGCAEVSYSYVVMAQDKVSGPQMCWVDVEAANSWDELDLNLNRDALQGMFDQLVGHGCRVGVYAQFKEWRAITGDWRTPSVAADWVSLAVPYEACARAGFSGGPVWLVQELATWPDVPVDSDWAC
ncbi:MAG TPA: hypothetical protein VF160_13365 [Candidatus Dormibacteraeota bacterium]